MRYALVVAVFLVGCATVSEVNLADGSRGYNINCGGTVMNFSHCLEKAGEICGARGYEVVNREGSAAPFALAGGSASATPQYASGAYYGSAGMMVTRNLFVKCK